MGKRQAASRSPSRRGRGGEVRDRVIGLRRVRAGDLAEHPSNWRRHPEHQRRALRALLREVGYADALLARETEDGSLELIDGHLRQSLDPDQIVPVLVVDVTAEEAEKLLVTLDPLAALAEPDPATLAELLGRVHTSSAAVRDLLADLARQAKIPIGVGLTDRDRSPRSRLSRRARSVTSGCWGSIGSSVQTRRILRATCGSSGVLMLTCCGPIPLTESNTSARPAGH